MRRKILRIYQTTMRNDWNPRFDSNSRKIVFQSDRDGNWEIYSMNLNGSNQLNITNHHQPTIHLLSFQILINNYS